MNNLDFWCFPNNVLYTKKLYTFEQASKLFSTLTDCSNCVDCINCEYCVDCFSCVRCIDCTGCMDCRGCTECRHCLNCQNCSADDNKKFCVGVTF